MATEITSLSVRFTADLRDLTRGIEQATTLIRRFGREMEKVGDQIGKVGRGWSLAVTAPITAFGGLSLRMAGEFESAMNRVQALTSATGEEFSALTAQAEHLGRTTQFTASQAADAMGFLAMAGFNTGQILGAMPSTLQLAAAASLDLARAADITTNILTGYGLTVTELGHANDVLVAAFTSANVDLTMLGESFRYAGPVAKSAGIAFEETAAAIALMGNAGIQGTMAGTSLRGAITRLLKPTAEVTKTLDRLGVTVTDSQGRLLSIVEVVRQLEEAGADTADMMTIFGQRAGPAMTALVDQGADSLATLTQKLGDSGGTAQRVADVQLRGLRGAMLELRSAWEGFQLAIAQSGPMQAATDLARRMTNVVNNLTGRWKALGEETQKAVLQFAGIAAAIGPGLVMLGKTTSILARLLGLMNPVVLGLTAVAGVVWAVRSNFLGLGDAASRVWQTIMDVGTRVVRVLDSAFRPWINILIAGLHSIGSIAVLAFNEYLRDPFVAAMRTIRNWARPVFSAIATGLEMIGRLGSAAAEKIRGMFTDMAEDAEEEGASFGSRVAAAIVENFGRDYVGEFSTLVLSGIERAQELIGRAIAQLRELGEAGGALADLQAAAGALDGIKGGLDDSGEVAEQANIHMKALARSVENVAFAFANSLGGAIKGVRDALRSFIEYAIRELVSLAARFAVFRAVTGIFGGGAISSLFGDSFLGFKIPGRAMGGPVTAGRPYLVGERGPELIVPRQSGTVVPNHALGGGSIAAAILDRLGPPPQAMSPHEAATHRWYRELIAEMVPDYASRGGRFG